MIKLQQNIKAFIRPGEQRGFVAECLEISVVTQGETLDEVARNLLEAVSLHLEGEDAAEFGLVASPSVIVIALRKDVRTHFVERSINTIVKALKFTPSLPHPILSAQTTNARSCSSPENRAANTKSHIPLQPLSPRALDHDGNWHCQSQSHLLVAIAVPDTALTTSQTSPGCKSRSSVIGANKHPCFSAAIQLTRWVRLPDFRS